MHQTSPINVAVPPASDSTFAIILGASEYPCLPESLSSPKFKVSGSRFKAYLETGLQLPKSHINDLFDLDGSCEIVCQRIASFLAGKLIRDLIVYYVGHGDSVEDTYCLFLRGTDQDKLLGTS